MVQYTIEKIREMAQGREFFIYGKGPRGEAWQKYLQRHDIRIDGFIDRSKTGADVLVPNILIEKAKGTKPLLLIAVQIQYMKEIKEFLNGCGYVRDIDYIAGHDFCKLYPTIEISGICNCKCASCNLSYGKARGGLMSFDQFKRIFDKMYKEIPILPSLSLFCWGEPFLNPDLPRIIEYCNSLKVEVELSSNMNNGKYIEDVIKAGPAVIRVPCSGVGEMYERNHTGGNFDHFFRNLYWLRRCIKEYKSKTSIVIMYHAYKDNLGSDYEIMRDFAKMLDFTFWPMIANIFPEAIYNQVIKGIPIPQEMRDISKYMLYNIDEQLAYSKGINKKCKNKRAYPNVRWDGAVTPCCNMEGEVLAEDYTAVSLDDLMRRQENCEWCRKCIENNLQYLFYTDGKVIEKNGVRIFEKVNL